MGSKKDPKIALCYVRQSFTRDGDDTNSPERQRANIEAFCDEKGWKPEWYEDVGGHKSGRYEKNRPQWLALKKRLEDSDIVALVANDLARLHRKGWKISALVEQLDNLNVALVLAAPGRQVDTSTPQGRLFVYFSAIFDEYYAADLSVRAKDSIAYRKSQGKTVGMTPFGTVRDEKGYLTPTPEGAWLLPSGKFVPASDSHSKPDENAIWKGYCEASKRILEIYVYDNLGMEKIAYKMNEEGWAFRTRKGKPRKFTRDDVRRVLANWPEYGGIIIHDENDQAKNRPGYKQDENSYELNPDRAVFPIDLLLEVAKARKERSIRPKNHGVNRDVRSYPLSGITFCAHCEALGINDASLRTRLSGAPGTTSNGRSRYRHKPGVKCGCYNRSVPCEEYEADFHQLLRQLTLNREALEQMSAFAMQFDGKSMNSKEQKSFEQEKAEAIALCKRRIEAARTVFLDGDMSQEEYVSRIEQNEYQITLWEARTSQTEKVGIELAMCVEAINKLEELWKVSTPEDKRALAHSLFEYIVYDLDARRIVDFRLKAFASRYIVLRAALEQEENENTHAQGMGTDTPHRRLELLFPP